MRFALTAIVWLIISQLNAQNKKDSVPNSQSLEEVIFSANKFAEKRKYVAQKIDVVSAAFIQQVNAQNAGDLLTQTGQVFVQKSQQGGSSPVLRGFEASRVLLVIDGIRMNNAIYRAGHLQNVITIDQNAMERVELLYGPSSTLYGSDALGGTLHFFTLQPQVAEKSAFHGKALLRYGSANQEKTGQLQWHWQGKKWAYRASLTHSDFGDMRMGNQYPKDYPNFGRRSQYVTQYGNPIRDTIVMNPRDNIQRFSGYRQWDMLHKILYQPNQKTSHLLNIQLSNSSNIPRYDRLQDVRNGRLRFADWHYGPQVRQLFAYTFQQELNKNLADRVRITGSYQYIEESRQTREFQRFERYDSRRERVSVGGLVMDFQKRIQQHEFSYGLDAQWNDVKSVADRTNLRTGISVPLDTRYPNGKNRLDHYGIFAQHLFKWKQGKWVVNDGIRFQISRLRSTIVDNSFFQLPVTDMRQDNQSITGNIGLVHMPSAQTRFSLGYAAGFRAPNIDDLARVFESNTAARRLVIPNDQIRPEYTHTVDLQVQQKWGSILQIDASVFYTQFRNAIVLAPFQLMGKDSILYNGQMAAIFANQNNARAYVTGFNLGLKLAKGPLTWYSTITYTYGRYETDPKAKTNIYAEQPNGSYLLTQASVREKPMDHIPPVFGKSSLQFQQSIWQAECFVLFNGWKQLKDYMADGEDNEQYATPKGMPAWYTLNVRGSVQFHRHWQLQVGLENILDRNYRVFASGFSAAGRHLMVAVRTQF